jgi:hypothetical protein
MAKTTTRSRKTTKVRTAIQGAAAFTPLVVEDDGSVRWDGKAKLAGRTITLDLSAPGKVSAARLATAAGHLADLAAMDRIGRVALTADLEDGDATSLYISHHLEELPATAQKKIFGAGKVTPPRFFAALRLRRIGLYPADDDEAICLDYGLEGTNYLLVVKLDKRREVVAVDMES